tara:strand:+ start:100 stop:1110 length:1011 start_codon:yes stop_codon:yes gene_type:complete
MALLNNKWIQFVILILFSRLLIFINEPLGGFVFLVGLIVIFVPKVREMARLDNIVDAPQKSTTTVSKDKENEASIDITSDDFQNNWVRKVSDWQYFGTFEGAVLKEEVAMSQVTKDMITKDNYFKIFRVIDFNISGDIYEGLESEFTSDRGIVWQKDENKIFKKNTKYSFRITCENYYQIVGDLENVKVVSFNEGKGFNMTNLYEFIIDMDGPEDLTEEAFEEIESWKRSHDLYNDVYLVNKGKYIDAFDLNNNTYIWKETGFDDIRAGKKPEIQGNDIGFEKALCFRTAKLPLSPCLYVWPSTAGPLEDEEKDKPYYDDWKDGIEVELPEVQSPK